MIQWVVPHSQYEGLGSVPGPRELRSQSIAEDPQEALTKTQHSHKINEIFKRALILEKKQQQQPYFLSMELVL